MAGAMTAADDASRFRERTLTAQDGLRLYRREYGDALSGSLPLLCLPGLVRNSRDYDAFGARHGTARHVVCPDYRGRGRSERAPDWRGYAPARDLDDIRHLIAVTGLHRAVVIGTSYGGLLAMALGAVVPAVLAGVVVNDIGPEASAARQRRILDYVGAGRTEPDWETAQRRLRERFPALSFPTDAAWDGFTRGTYDEMPDGTLRPSWDPAIARAFAEPSGVSDLWSLFRGLARVPVLLVRGGRSDVLGADTAARMQASHPDLTLVTVPDCGHAPSLAEPECADAIDSFMNRIQARE